LCFVGTWFFLFPPKTCCGPPGTVTGVYYEQGQYVLACA
jgi:hypothetical protein